MLSRLAQLSPTSVPFPSPTPKIASAPLPQPLCPAKALSNQPAGQPGSPGDSLQILAQQLIVKDFHLTLFCQLLAQTDGLFPHLQKEGHGDKG